MLRPLLASALLLAAACATTATAQRQAPAGAVDVPRWQYTRHVLPNGLVLILHEDRSTPIVTVNVRYAAGARHDPPDRSGLAHVVEHMMYEGSENVAPGEHRSIVQSMGGVLNAATSEDWTRYHQTVPTHALETVLWLEADRMATPLRLEPARLGATRDIIRNERRQMVDNQPFGTANDVTLAHLFPEGHAYHRPSVGSMEDIARITLDDVRAFHRAHYMPNNAVVVIAGDFRSDQARRWVERYFGSIPRGTLPPRPEVPRASLATERRLVLEDARARTPMLRFAWPGVGAEHGDLAALRALALTLTVDRTARLVRALVHERQLATAVAAEHFEMEKGGIFQVVVTPRPNASLTDIEHAVDSVIAGLRDSPFTAAELRRAQNTEVVRSNVRVQHQFQRTDRMAEGQLFHGEPMRFADEIRALASLTPAAVDAAARRYLTNGRMVLSMVPAGRAELASKPDLPHVNVTPRPAAGGGN